MDNSLNLANLTYTYRRCKNQRFDL